MLGVQVCPVYEFKVQRFRCSGLRSKIEGSDVETFMFSEFRVYDYRVWNVCPLCVESLTCGDF